MNRITLLVLAIAFLQGCSSGPQPESLIGLTQPQVVEKLGKPVFVSDQVFRPGLPSGPQTLEPGETYIQMSYFKIHDHAWWVYLASDPIYQRVTGQKDVSSDQPLVFEVETADLSNDIHHWGKPPAFSKPMRDMPR